MTSRRGLGRSSVVVAGAVIVAAAAGVGAGMLATNEEPAPMAAPPPPITVRAGQLSLELPAGWSRLKRAPPLAGLTGPRVVGVRAENADVVIAQRPLEGPSLLPGALLSALTGPLPQPARVSVGEYRAYRHGPLFDLQPDTRVEILALPTSRGVATVACVADAATGPSSGDCVTALERLDLGGATAADAEPGVAVALTLRRVVRRLDATRLPERRRLAAARLPATRSDAAERLARAHDRAAAQLAPLADAPADTATIAALRALAVAYRSYAGASARRDVGDARAAAQRIRDGERALARQLAARRAFRLDAT